MKRKKLIIPVFITFLLSMNACDNNSKSCMEKINSLEEEIFQLKSSTATFSTSSRGVSKVDNFWVSLKDVRKYADGYILTFEIGNPLLFTYKNMIVDLMMGKSRSKEMKYEDWRKTLLEKKHVIKKDILPGVWNKVEIIVSPAKEEDLSFIYMKIDNDYTIFNLKSDHRENVE